MNDYIRKLQDPRWQKKRLKVLERDEWKCQLWHAHKGMLVVHHKYYTKGKDPWEYPMKALITLCNDCHDKLKPKKNKEIVYPDDYSRFLECNEILKKYSHIIKLSNDGMTFSAVAENIKKAIDYAEYGYSSGAWSYDSFKGYINDNFKEIEKHVVEIAKNNFFDKYRNTP